MKHCMSFIESETGQTTPGSSLFHVIPVPYEKTVSYGKGTSRGPGAIIAASQQLETFDGTGIPIEYGIYTCRAVNCRGRDTTVLKRIEDAVITVLETGKIPVILGGEHTVSYGPAMAMKQHFGNFGLVHFDAHADLRDLMEGRKFAHGCVMRRIHELKIPLIQIATRGYSTEEHTYRINNSNIKYYDAASIYRDNIFNIEFPDNFPDDIYISVDVDALDPSVIQHTGTPVPGGLLWYDFFRFINSIPASKRIRGFDVVELAPVKGSSVSDYTAAQLTYNMMGIISRRI